ncbi:hypothetical protein GW916_06765 [bacterium]|nr:hypothetical protein [bacterium]
MESPDKEIGPFDYGYEKIFADAMSEHLIKCGFIVSTEMYGSNEHDNWEESTNLYLSTDNEEIKFSVYSPWYDSYIRILIFEFLFASAIQKFFYPNSSGARIKLKKTPTR